MILIETRSTLIEIIWKGIENKLITQKISSKDFLDFKNNGDCFSHASLKTKHLLANLSSFTSKGPSKAIMHRSKVRN